MEADVVTKLAAIFVEMGPLISSAAAISNANGGGGGGGGVNSLPSTITNSSSSPTATTTTASSTTPNTITASSYSSDMMDGVVVATPDIGFTEEGLPGKRFPGPNCTAYTHPERITEVSWRERERD